MLHQAANSVMRNLEASDYYWDNNRNGKIFDFKNYQDSKNCPNKNDPNGLYHERALAGNYLFGMLEAATHDSLDEALGDGQGFRAGGKLASGNWGGGGWEHPADEQQAIQDGYNAGRSMGLASQPF